MTDKELQERIEANKEHAQKDVNNLRSIYHRNRRPKIESMRDLFIYYFDILFGELLFFDDVFPYLKLGMLPHFCLLLAVLLAYDKEYQLMSLVLLLYLVQMGLIVFMGIFLKVALRTSLPEDDLDKD